MKLYKYNQKSQNTIREVDETFIISLGKYYYYFYIIINQFETNIKNASKINAGTSAITIAAYDELGVSRFLMMEPTVTEPTACDTSAPAVCQFNLRTLAKSRSVSLKLRLTRQKVGPHIHKQRHCEAAVIHF